MKKSILLIGLMSLIINSAFSQYDKPLDSAVSNWSYSKQIDSNLLKIFDSSLLRDKMQNYPKDTQTIEKWEFQDKRTIDDNMTILKPIGNYPSLIIKPDTTIRYSLLIKKP